MVLTLADVMHQYQQIHSYGLVVWDSDRHKPPQEQQALLARRRQELRDETERVEATAAWIAVHFWPQKTINTRYGSSARKHLVEDDIDYIPNGTFIAAMLMHGYRMRPDGPNAYFNVPTASIKPAARACPTRRWIVSP